MTYDPNALQNALLTLLTQEYGKLNAPLPTNQKIEEEVDKALANNIFNALKEQRQHIVDEVLRRINTSIGSASVLADDGNHVAWLKEQDRKCWRLWPRLANYLAETKPDEWTPRILHELDDSTEKTLDKLESPLREGQWDRRGLVVGHVQSGKTAHYTALAAKAIDAGYQIVIILAGIHNSLRSQTQERIDEELIGRDSKSNNQAILSGVGEFDKRKGAPRLPFIIWTCTTSEENGDFRPAIANQVYVPVGEGQRLVMVVKKNAAILRQLTGWLRSLTPQPGQGRIPAPALIIDDEADNSSITTNDMDDPDNDPTRINGLIRKLLISFDRISFVGYTATPMSNIFIREEVDPEEYREFGLDLYPSSFIIGLKPPSNYVGSAKVFGRIADDAAGFEEQEPLPMHVDIDDWQAWMPSGHRTVHIPGELPASLKEALNYYILTCTIRSLRGHMAQKKHNTMLVHVTRFVAVQTRVERAIESEIESIKNIILYGTEQNKNEIKNKFKEIWEKLIVEKHQIFASQLGDECEDLPKWEEVWGAIPENVKKIKVIRVSGGTGDVLAYSRAKESLSLIAIGGDRLSRGLTLSGLTVSYYLRNSNAFDTMMQMGRWFGYRPGYIDLCRVYTPSQLLNQFKELTLTMDAFHEDLDHMAKSNLTPMEFGGRMREPSGTLRLTAANKMRTGAPIPERFAGDSVEANHVDRTGPQFESNYKAVHDLIHALGTPVRSGNHFIWKTGFRDILTCLSQYEAYSDPRFYNQSAPLRKFISAQVEQGELVDWTVVLISGLGETRPFAEFDSKCVNRILRKDSDPTKWVIGSSNQNIALMGSEDEARDLTTEERTRACELSRNIETPEITPTIPKRRFARAVRPVTRGLLNIYPVELPTGSNKKFCPFIGISFPNSDTARGVDYVVNRIYLKAQGVIDDDGEIHV